MGGGAVLDGPLTDAIKGYDAAAMGVTAWWQLYWYENLSRETPNPQDRYVLRPVPDTPAVGFRERIHLLLLRSEAGATIEGSRHDGAERGGAG